MVPTESTKKITCKDGECTVTECFEPMRRYSRTGRDGKLVKCPVCESTKHVYHLRDKTMTCPTCKTSSDKYQWMIEREVIYSSY